MLKVFERLKKVAEDTTPSLTLVGEWMVVHPIQTLSQSAEEIAALTGTSVAAINRFSRAAGFESFTDLKAQLGLEMQSVMAPVQKIGGGLPPPEEASDESKIWNASAAPRVAQVVGQMMKARRIWILGFGASSYIAGYAEHVLTPFVGPITAVAGGGGTEEAARRLMLCGKGDVLLALSLPRYSRDTVQLARFARERGVYVVVITDSADTSLAKLSHNLLPVPANHSVLPSSAVGMMAVIEALAAGAARMNPNAVPLAHELIESVLTHLD